MIDRPVLETDPLAIELSAAKDGGCDVRQRFGLVSQSMKDFQLLYDGRQLKDLRCIQSLFTVDRKLQWINRNFLTRFKEDGTFQAGEGLDRGRSQNSRIIDC